jgi:type I restriction enzyme, S subunit
VTETVLDERMVSLPAGWLWKPFGQLVRHSQNGISKRQSSTGTPTRVLRLADVRDGEVDESSPREIKLSDEEIGKYAVLAGDLLCVRVNGSRSLTGRLVYFRSRKEWAYCDHFIRFRLNPDIADAKYLAYYFDTEAVRRYLGNHMVSTAGQNTVSQGTMFGVAVPLAPPNQQRAIVAEIEKQFSRLDEAGASLKRTKANLKRYKAAVLKAAVEGKLTSTNAPSWIRTNLGAVLTSIEAGKSFKCEERPPNQHEIGVVKVSAVTWGTYDEQESKTCLDSDRIKPRYFVRPGDFLFSRANTIELVGACVIVHKATRRIMLSDKILRFCFSDEVLPQWVLYWLRSDIGRKEIQRLSTGNQESMRNIGQVRIRQIAFALPSLDEQQQLVAEVERHLSVIDELEANIEANRTRADRLRQSILSNAFTGKLVERNPTKTMKGGLTSKWQEPYNSDV